MNRRQSADILRLQRALQIWQILLSAANNRQVLTYEIVAELIGVGKKGAISIKLYLAILMRYCKNKHLPPITALIVQKGVGRPGPGLKTLSPDPDRDREKVFAHNWFQLKPLAISDLLPFDKHQKSTAPHTLEVE